MYGFVIDRYVRGIMSPCNRCSKMVSFSEHKCEGYPKKDGIPPKVYSGREKSCSYFCEKNERGGSSGKR